VILSFVFSMCLKLRVQLDCPHTKACSRVPTPCLSLENCRRKVFAILSASISRWMIRSFSVRYTRACVTRFHHLGFLAPRLLNRRPTNKRVTESIEPPWGGDAISYYHGLKDGKPMVLTATGAERSVSEALVRPDCSIVGQLFDPSSFAELASLSQNYEKVRIYREWAFGRSAVFREPQQADMRNNFLEDDFSNLGLFLSKLRKTPKAKKAIIENLRKLYDGLTDFEVVAEGGSVQVFFTEGDFVIPAARLSDGTLRFLCLLAILCDPEPPPLICIEEPELGLHPDILPTVADLLKSASERTQIIVTTHSDILVDAMTDCPESVVVCEKHKGQTEMTRLSASELAVWLEKYRLGQLWIQGQLGGTRW